MKYRFALLKTLPLLFAMLIYPGVVCAQVYPAKAVRIVVPFPAGAGGDFVTRLFTPRLTEVLGQQFIVDNRSGAAGNIGAEIAARAAPDGYTLLTVSASLAIGQSLYKNLRFDLARDFEPIALFASTPYVLAVHPSVPAKNVAELVALAKARPGQLTFGSSGNGGGTHLAAEMLKMQAHVDLLHVPYKGTAPAIADLIGGQISMMFASQLLPQVKAGRLRGLAITSARRSPAAPELPTVAESGVPGYEAGTWFGLIAPAGIPREIVTRLNATITRIEQTPEIRDRLMAQSSAEPLGGTPEQVGAYIRSEIAKWRKVITAAGLRVE
ncbi:MAG: tripartite tricarboxylate transporter substrate binding protein [Betaproteobacteria bacterium]|nr:tripartite tricarboxylate transporter substrate binding protein [Betaproteobacteria bacterium]